MASLLGGCEAVAVGAGALKSRSKRPPPPPPLLDLGAGGAAADEVAVEGGAGDARAEEEEEEPEGGPARRSIEVVGADLRAGAGAAEVVREVEGAEAEGVGACRIIDQFAANIEGTPPLTTSASPSESSVSGGGGGPCIAQRFDSYLERMKDSILLFHRPKLESAFVSKNSAAKSESATHCSGGACPGFK